MASVRTPSTPATDAPDTVTQHLQSAHFSTAFPASVEETVDHQRNTESIPIRSLFGPFPNSADSSRADQEEGQVPEQPSSDQIATTGQNQYATRSATLNQNPSDREPWSPAEYDEPETRDDPPLPPLMKEKTAPAIGPATDKPTAVPKEIEMEGPVLYITLLLSSTGARHPYKLDEKYLRKRNVIVEGNNPINISLYKLKELILRDWREEWEAKPSSPESIRLISMGKLLNDKASLSDSGFTNGITPHIIHMTIKPQEIVDEEDAKIKAAGSGRAENERSPGCRCIIQ